MMTLSPWCDTFAQGDIVAKFQMNSVGIPWNRGIFAFLHFAVEGVGMSTELKP